MSTPGQRVFETLSAGLVLAPEPWPEDTGANGWPQAVLALLANVAYDAGFELQRNWKVRP